MVPLVRISASSFIEDDRNGLIVNAELPRSNGRAELDATLVMLEQISEQWAHHRGGDKGFETREFRRGMPSDDRYTACGAERRQTRQRRAIDARTTRHTGNPRVRRNANGSRSALRNEQISVTDGSDHPKTSETRKSTMGFRFSAHR
jgi:hypothetical protein